nr:MAG TPA: Head fiber protein [Bacteriophage sp.]
MKYLDNNGLLYVIQKIKTWLTGKVDKVDGKGLSTNDYTTEEKNKLAGLSNYTLPTASAETKGGVKIGSGLTMTGDVLSADAQEGTKNYNELSNIPIINMVGTSDNPIIISDLENEIYKLSGVVKEQSSADATTYTDPLFIGVEKKDDNIIYINYNPVNDTNYGMVLEVITLEPNSFGSYNRSSSFLLSTDVLMKLLTLIESNNLVAEYDKTQVYNVGALCTYNGMLYKCKTQTTSGLAFNPNYWEPISVFDVIDGKGYQTASQVETTITSKGYQTASDVQTAITNSISSVMTYKGTVANYSDLPANAKTGDTYNITNKSANNKAGDNAVWNGTSWDVLSGTVDLSNYYTKTDMVSITNDEIDTICATE